MRLLKQYFFLYVVSAAIACANWFSRKFGPIELEQFLYHLELSSQNIIKADASIIQSGIKNVLVAPIIYALILVLLWKFLQLLLRRSAWGRKLSQFIEKPKFLACSMLASFMYLGHASILLPDTSVEDKDWIAEYYVAPEIVNVPLRKKNLVLIYAESLEASLNELYGNDHLFDQVSFEKYSPAKFSSFKQLSDTGWTIAGIVSSQCGLPLKPLGLFNENKIGESTTRFMPKATCLGDVLHQNGYKNIFVGGASRRFSGKLSFLQTHGYDEVYGRRQFLELDDSLPLNDWGVNDDDLFKMAKQKYLSLKQSGQPFNLTILTLGMHFPDGYLSPSCPAKFGDYRDSIACTTGLLADYVEFIVKNDPHADTDVIIVGDHLTMKSNVAKSLEMNTHRTIFNIFINRSGSKRIVREEIDHFDLFPTILADLKFSLKDGRAALGCSGFDKANCYSLVHDPKINAKLAKHSDLYDSLWKQ